MRQTTFSFSDESEVERLLDEALPLAIGIASHYAIKQKALASLRAKMAQHRVRETLTLKSKGHGPFPQAQERKIHSLSDQEVLDILLPDLAD